MTFRLWRDRQLRTNNTKKLYIKINEKCLSILYKRKEKKRKKKKGKKQSRTTTNRLRKLESHKNNTNTSETFYCNYNQLLERNQTRIRRSLNWKSAVEFLNIFSSYIQSRSCNTCDDNSICLWPFLGQHRSREKKSVLIPSPTQGQFLSAVQLILNFEFSFS